MERAKHAACVLLLTILGCTSPRGDILFVRDVGGDAAVLRWKGVANGKRELLRVASDGETRWTAQVDAGPSAKDALAADEVSPWVVRTDESTPSLRAIDASTGSGAWTWTAPARSDPHFLGEGGGIYVWWEGTVAQLDRATGAERWRRTIPSMLLPKVAFLLGGVVLGDFEFFVVFDGDGKEVLRSKTYPDAQCTTAAGLVWTDPERRTWLYGAETRTVVPVALDGAVRRGCGMHAGRVVVPVQADGGMVRVASIGTDASVGWGVELGRGAHILLTDASDWPRYVPFVLEVDAGRQLVSVDVKEGRVVQFGAPVDPVDIATPSRVTVGSESMLVARQVLFRLNDGGRIEAVRIPGVERQAPETQVGARGVWTLEQRASVRFVPWSSSEVERLSAADSARMGL